ncbi:hypothetical protein IGI39_003901 [Enterococcus sp. AZ135]|uniref:hypothetical protein n=1 Tax=unclassified Enterococcus TaxID=2608891 RepID=UPI003F21E4EE
MNSQELIQEYLLDKKNRIKLSILQFLADNPFYITSDYLAERFQMSLLNFSIYMLNCNINRNKEPIKNF